MGSSNGMTLAVPNPLAEPGRSAAGNLHGSRLATPVVLLTWAISAVLVVASAAESRPGGPIEPVAAMLVLMVVLSQATVGAGSDGSHADESHRLAARS